MAVPTYEELLTRYNVDGSLMELMFNDDHLMEIGSQLDKWEPLALSLRLPSTEIENIRSSGDIEMQRYKLFKCWKQRYGSTATYKALVEALLQISRTDLAEKVVALRKSLSDTTQSPPSSPSETNLATLTSPASSSGLEDMSPTASMTPSIPVDTQTAQGLVPTLTQLDEDFFKLVNEIESILKVKKVPLNIIKKRFRMLPQSIRRQQETDTDFKATRQKILNSRTTEELLDNLTALKHWSYMMPETLEHILKDVKIDNIYQQIDTYKGKLMTFKANTKLRELIGISFPVPDYCMELTMEVEGWEDKTIWEVENRAVNIVRQAAYSSSPHDISLGWKEVTPGSIKVTFILMESVKIIPERLTDEREVLSAQVDAHIAPGIDYTKMVSGKKGVPWGHFTARGRYNAGGGRDVLILAPDLSLPHPEAVARRPGQLTEEDKLKLQSQGLSHDCKDELDIIRARYDLDKRYKIVKVKSESRDEVIERMAYLLNTTQNDGVILHYIGAGRRGTGDWCFEDGSITFRDIAQLYLRASHNFKGRVLTIVSDCSYSGCWVRDCMEFLDEQGVQPCGHKARKKGIIIKVVTSCKSYEIPTEYCFSVSGVDNIKNTGMMAYWLSKQLLETQTTTDINSSHFNCNSQTIDEPCTLPPGLTWRRLEEMKRKPSSSAKVETRDESIMQGATYSSSPHVNLSWKQASLPPLLIKNEAEHLTDLNKTIDHTKWQDTLQPGSKSRHFTKAEHKASVPFLYHSILDCDSSGQDYTIIDHDITLRIPKGAVQEEKVHLEIGVTMYGPFHFPDNTRPISPIIWLCLVEDTELQKPIQVILPHFLTQISDEQLCHHQVRFATANHVTNCIVSDENRITYKFHNCDIKPLFASVDGRSYGVLVSKHFCFYCITANQTPELARKAGYGLVQIETSFAPDSRRSEIHFCAIFLLKTCLKSLEEQFPREEGHHISSYNEFKFESDEIKVVAPFEHTQCTIAMAPLAAKIRAAEIDFWRKDFDTMQIRHKRKMYPPRVKMTVIMNSSDSVFKLPINFTGCSVDSLLDVELAFPLGLPSLQTPAPPLSNPETSSSKIKCGKPNLADAFRQLLPVSKEWKNIGALLTFSSDALDRIEHDEPDTNSRLRAMLSEWLKQVKPPPTWTQLVSAVQPFDPSKAKELENCFKDLSAHKEQ